MPTTRLSPDASRNLLLAALRGRKYRRFLSRLKPITLAIDQVLHEAGGPIRYVYFPTSGMVSLVGVREDGRRSTELAVVGDYGMVGAPACLGVVTTGLYQAVVQLPGVALRATLEETLELNRDGNPFAGVLRGYLRLLFVQLARSAVCNCFHGPEARLARWLLLTGDHAGSDEFQMKQEFIARMLGARRVAVSSGARGLREAGLITYRRGFLTVLDRRGLEKVACPCYLAVRGEVERLRSEGGRG